MTRRHFRALAAAIRELPDNPTKWQVISAISQVCRSFNHNFDWQRFKAACGDER